MSTPSTPQPSGSQQDGGAAARERAARRVGAPSPLLDRSVLADMERDFSDSSVVVRFARDFAVSLEGKIDRLDSSLQDGDDIAARDAVISLSTSADMIGAVRLGDVARAVLASLSTPGADAVANLLLVDGLRTCAADTLEELGQSYPGSA